ncbi:hypothetical protein BKA70DRAFT_1556626 [Coprinopsis sp. MPI-PUGE-AT-0042]|nr:hypothetical protein BKA70DRAFT_1556626 [Coprinopsis sp. MPI-PUGE-AT-0042]
MWQIPSTVSRVPVVFFKLTALTVHDDMHIPRLPPEIISLIVDQVAVAGKGPWKGLKRDLKACSLTTHLFLSLARPYIFASISLSAKKARKAFVNLKWTRHDHLTISRYVKELRLTYADAGRLAVAAVEDLEEMMLDLRDLRSFCFRFDTKGRSEWDRLPFIIRNGISRLILESPRLNRFETDMIAFPFDDVITADLQHREPRLERIPCLKTLHLCEFYQPTLDGMLNGPEGINLTQLETLTVEIQTESQYILVKELLAQSQALKQVEMALDCTGEGEDNSETYPVPLASFHPSSHCTLQHLRLDLYVWVDDRTPATWGAQYLGLTASNPEDPLERPMLLSFTGLASLKLTIYIYGDLKPLLSSDNWRDLDGLLAPQDALPHLHELAVDIVIYPEVDAWGDGNYLEDAQNLFDKLEPLVFNSKHGVFKNIWKRAKDQGRRKFKFKFKPSVHIAEEVEVVPFHPLRD